MKVVCLKYFQHISRIIEIIQPHIIQKQQQNKQKNNKNIELQLYQELEYLKTNVENLLRYCQGLENQNKQIKIHMKGNKILKRDSYKIQQNPYSNKKVQSALELNKNFNIEIQKENKQLLQTRELYLGSLNKIYTLKNEVQKLKGKLNQMQETYDKLDKLDSKEAVKSDMFNTDKSLILMMNKSIQNVDFQHLLCDQELNIEQSIFSRQEKENISQKINKSIKSPMIQRLINKGISYKQTKSLRNKQLDGLNSIIQRYRSQSKCENMKTAQPLIKASQTGSNSESKQPLAQDIGHINCEIYLYR